LHPTALRSAIRRDTDEVLEVRTSPPARTLSIALICPRFEPSFFGLEFALPILPGDKRAASFPGSLPLLAALVPDGHVVRIFDENVAALDFNELRRFDVVGLTGMIVQRKRMDEILEQLSGRGPLVCVGGPYITVEESYFAGRCDVRFIGEADTTWPRFIRDLADGQPIQPRYVQEAPTDLQSLPCPRYDLVSIPNYLTATTQFGRGCPFLCEFCDIIVIFGRKPRAKSPAQILSELDRLYALGIRNVFVVDDNFIANKAFAKAALAAVIQWQEAHGYPMTFSTEASVDLADQPEILDQLWRANFTSVFIGIETPRTKSLQETRKTQNLRGDSLEAKLSRIRDAGIVIQAGFILGFDHDDESIFDEQFEFLQRTGIGTPFISVLSPIPSTPLYDRLAREGRLRTDDGLVWFEPKLMSRERLKQGYLELNARLFEPEIFFERVFERQFRSAAFHARRLGAQTRRPRGLKARMRDMAAAAALTYRLASALVRHRALTSVGRAYVRSWWRHNRSYGARRLRMTEYLSLCIRHWHCYRVTAQVRSNWGLGSPTMTVGADAVGPAPPTTRV
jgi:radical SAM superfamily enzyme YgiQ (UPF0313 family)